MHRACYILQFLEGHLKEEVVIEWGILLNVAILISRILYVKQVIAVKVLHKIVKVIGVKLAERWEKFKTNILF